MTLNIWVRIPCFTKLLLSSFLQCFFQVSASSSCYLFSLGGETLLRWVMDLVIGLVRLKHSIFSPLMKFCVVLAVCSRLFSLCMMEFPVPSNQIRCFSLNWQPDVSVEV